MAASTGTKSAGDERAPALREPWADQLATRADIKARQAAKIRELGEALATAGFRTLDRQANALGLSRSTTWTVLRASHKNSGLSAAIINRMLRAPQLPPPVRVKIFEYIKAKTTGSYGHSKTQRQLFAERLAITGVGRLSMGLAAQQKPKDRLRRTVAPVVDADDVIESARARTSYRHSS